MSGGEDAAAAEEYYDEEYYEEEEYPDRCVAALSTRHRQHARPSVLGFAPTSRYCARLTRAGAEVTMASGGGGGAVRVAATTSCCRARCPWGRR
jgi:hypothetical protein